MIVICADHKKKIWGKSRKDNGDLHINLVLFPISTSVILSSVLGKDGEQKCRASVASLTAYQPQLKINKAYKHTYSYMTVAMSPVLSFKF